MVARDSLFTTRGSVTSPFQGSGLHPDGDRFILARTVVTEDESIQEERERLILIGNFLEELKTLVAN